MKFTMDELIAEFKSMTMLELHEFTKRFEETFNVKAAFYVPANVPTEQPLDKSPSEEDEEPTFDLTLQSAGPSKIQVIKEIRAIKKLGLKEAKDLVDSAPVVLFAGLSREGAADIKLKFAALGATVEVT